MVGLNSSPWKIFKFVSFQQISNLKYCTLYEKKRKLNVTHVLRYICYDNEICCDRGNGCCPIHPTKYYETWCFWIFIFGITLAFYLLCWYCKKLKKNRQAVLRANVSNAGNPRRILPCLRSLDTNNVDHLLETLILNYRSHLTNEHQGTENVDETKVLNNIPPPEYTDALKMPKPNLEGTSITSNESMRNHADDEAENYVALNIDEQSIPTYEEAIKQI